MNSEMHNYMKSKRGTNTDALTGPINQISREKYKKKKKNFVYREIAVNLKNEEQRTGRDRGVVRVESAP